MVTRWLRRAGNPKERGNAGEVRGYGRIRCECVRRLLHDNPQRLEQPSWATSSSAASFEVPTRCAAADDHSYLGRFPSRTPKVAGRVGNNHSWGRRSGQLPAAMREMSHDILRLRFRHDVSRAMIRHLRRRGRGQEAQGMAWDGHKRNSSAGNMTEQPSNHIDAWVGLEDRLIWRAAAVLRGSRRRERGSR